MQRRCIVWPARTFCPYFCTVPYKGRRPTFRFPVFRLSLRPYLAMVLLFCFVRVQLPEAALLALHAHSHTEHEETQRPGRAKGKALIGQQHQHCHAEQLFDAPFQTAAPVRVPVRLTVPRYLALRVPATLSNSAGALRGTALRGPPQD